MIRKNTPVNSLTPITNAIILKARDKLGNSPVQWSFYLYALQKAVHLAN